MTDLSALIIVLGVVFCFERWLANRPSVKLTVDGVSIEASSVNEATDLLALAFAHQRGAMTKQPDNA